jgi:hypothetical protein
MVSPTRIPQDAVAEKQRLDKSNAIKSNFKSEYKIGTYQYPDDLRVRPDLQHFVAFFINVRDKGRLGINNKDKQYFVSDTEQKRLDALAADRPNLQPVDIVQGIKTVQNNAGTIAASAYLLSRLGSGTRFADIGTTIAGTAGAALAGKVGAKLFQNVTDNATALQIGTTHRLKDVVALHLEERPTVRYTTRYNNGGDMGFLTGLLVQGSAAASAGTLKNLAPEIQARALSEFAKLPGLGVLNNLRELSTKTRTNPFREVLFEAVDYRSFQFKYRFYPKSKSETDRVHDIITMFKVHMHPELTSGKLFFIYPSEFDIQYYYKDKENNYLNKFARCALVDMQVDYGGEQFTTFEDGAPTEIGMSLTFQELEQMTSEGIEKYGY